MAINGSASASDYDHLNEDNPIQVAVSWDALADSIVAQNYGLIRFLAALVRARQRQNKERERRNPDVLLEKLLEIINGGLN